MLGSSRPARPGSGRWRTLTAARARSRRGRRCPVMRTPRPCCWPVSVGTPDYPAAGDLPADIADGSMPTTSHDWAQPQRAHQPLHGAPGRRDALAVQLVPHLPGAVPFPAVLIDPQDLFLQRGVPDRPRRRRPRPGRVVPRRRDAHLSLAQGPADRPDPEQAPVGLDIGHHQDYRWPSSAAKKALAVRKIAFTRRSSAFSRSSARIRVASAGAVPGRRPRSICACLAQPRSVSAGRGWT